MNDYLIEHYFKSVKRSIETLLEENKRVIAEKNEFEFRHKSIKNSDFWECADSDWNNQPTEHWIKSFSPRVKLLIVTFNKEVKPAVMEKHHFDERYESLWKTIFWKIWTNKNLMQGSMSMFFWAAFLYGSRAAIETLIDEKNL